MLSQKTYLFLKHLSAKLLSDWQFLFNFPCVLGSCTMHAQGQPGFQSRAHSGIPLAICSAHLTRVLGTISHCRSWPGKACFPKLPFMTLNLFPNQAAVPDPSPGGVGVCTVLISGCVYSPGTWQVFSFPAVSVYTAHLDTLMQQAAPLNWEFLLVYLANFWLFLFKRVWRTYFRRKRMRLTKHDLQSGFSARNYRAGEEESPAILSFSPAPPSPPRSSPTPIQP